MVWEIKKDNIKIVYEVQKEIDSDYHILTIKAPKDSDFLDIEYKHAITDKNIIEGEPAEITQLFVETFKIYDFKTISNYGSSTNGEKVNTYYENVPVAIDFINFEINNLTYKAKEHNINGNKKVLDILKQISIK